MSVTFERRRPVASAMIIRPRVWGGNLPSSTCACSRETHRGSTLASRTSGTIGHASSMPQFTPAFVSPAQRFKIERSTASGHD